MILENVYKTGLEEMDRQHATLARMIIKVCDILLSEEINLQEDLPGIIDKATALVKQHFLYEENLMREYNISGIVEHINSHEEMVVKLIQIKDLVLHLSENKQKLPHEKALELCSSVEKLFIEHIETEDKKIAQFILNSQ